MLSIYISKHIAKTTDLHHS